VRVSLPGALPPDLKEALKEHKEDVIALLQGATCDFLPRPLGQENNPDAWEC